jgi:hypothetical protein
MVTLLLNIGLPIVFIVAFLFRRFFRNLKDPSRIPFGCMASRVCVVYAREIKDYCRKMMELREVGARLQRKRRWQQFRVMWGHARAMMWDTRLFQGSSLFEKDTIDAAKSSLDYSPREMLVTELVAETSDMRLKLFRLQVYLLRQTILGRRIDPNLFIEILGEYKHLEQEMVILADMSEYRNYREMLIDNLGLRDWRIVEGGLSGPEPA